MHMRSLLAVSAAAIFAASTWGTAAAKTAGYYQMPVMNDQHLVFASEGDLWRAPANGGDAVRLTTHTQSERSPSISPNGQWIAFAANYDGPTEIYIMPMAGGAPKRITHEGGSVAARGWLDDNRVLYRSSNIPGTIPRVLRTVDVKSLAVTDIPLADADQAALMPDKRTLIFTRHGLNLFSDNAVQYRGGRMAQIWRYNLNSQREAVRLAADFGAPMRHPMVWQDRIYFISDKSGTDNIWSMDQNGSGLTQHSQSTQWQIRTPSLHGGKIAYQSGADLFSFDLSTNLAAPISVALTSDRDRERVRWLKKPLDYLSDARMSPSGKSVTMTARGKFVTGFTGERRRVDYKLPDGARARSAVMSADGEAVYVLIDNDLAGGIWTFPADGRGEGKAVKSGLESYVWDIFASPTDAALIYSDKRGRLFHLDVSTGAATLMDSAASSSDFNYGDITWSKDGRYAAYAFYDARDLPQIAVYDTKTHTKTVMTSSKYESFAPAFSADSAWLYFLSNRNFSASRGSPWGDRNMGPEFEARSQIYALQLDPEAAFPFEPDDELTAQDDKDASKDEDKTEDKDDKSEDVSDVSLDLEGAPSRLWQVPVPPGDYTGLAATAKHLFIMEGGYNGFVGTNDDSPSLKRLAISDDNPKVTDYAGDVQRFSLSADHKTLFVQTGEDSRAKFLLLGAGGDMPGDASDKMVRVSDWRLDVDPKNEWRQMALDAWRLHRDFAYDENLRGVNWDAVRSRFVPLASRLGHRAELNDLLAQMSAELGILHSQIRPGELPRDTESGAPAFFGATYKQVKDGLQITSIHNGEAERPETLGPLRRAGVDVREGDIIIAIDGRAIVTQADLTTALTQKEGQQVRLDFKRGRTDQNEIIVPTSRRGESMLLYNSWVQNNREAVAKASGGKIGYLHLRAMGSSDIASFARDYYEHADKDAMIIDVRGNRGGSIDSWILGTLLRRVWAHWPGANGGPSIPNMQQTFRGHLAVLINEGTYSDGETFAAGIRALDLGPLIGTRTAGAGIWLSDRNRLVDGGQARVAEFGQLGLDGRWLIEGLGVSPDIAVTNLPQARHSGIDQQLDTSISYLKDKMIAEPIPPLRRLPYPPLGQTGRDVD